MDFYGFWSSFYNSQSPEGAELFFREIFKNVILPNNKNKIDIHSLFPFNKSDVNKDSLSAQFSGEEYHNPIENYDISLIMEKEDITKGVICMPLIIICIYENNYLHLLSKPRRLLSDNKMFCTFVVANPLSQPRTIFCKKLSEYKTVSCCGPHLNNTGILAPREQDMYLVFLQQFKFMICFENTSSPYYLSEKILNAWLGGTIPIYWGSSKCQEWLNPKAFLYLENDSEEAMNKLIKQVIELDNDNERYIAMYNQPLLNPDKPLPDELNINVLKEKIQRRVDYISM